MGEKVREEGRNQIHVFLFQGKNSGELNNIRQTKKKKVSSGCSRLISMKEGKRERKKQEKKRRRRKPGAGRQRQREEETSKSFSQEEPEHFMTGKMMNEKRKKGRKERKKERKNEGESVRKWTCGNNREQNKRRMNPKKEKKKTESRMG